MKNKKIHSKNNTFHIPEGYFDDIEQRVLEQIQQKEIHIPTDGFSIPEHYFETFQHRLSRKLIKDKTPKKLLLLSYKTIYYTLVASAALMLLFVGIKYFFSDVDTPLHTVSFTDIDYYIDNGYMTLHHHDIALLLDNNNLTTLDIYIEDYDIDDQVLIDYLYENLENH